jgi:hypothetical protein
MAMGGTSFGGVRTGQNVDGQLGTPYYIIKWRKEPFSGGQSRSTLFLYSPQIHVWLHISEREEFVVVQYVIECNFWQKA